MSETLPLFLVLPVLLVLSGIASGSETALFRLSHRERAELRRAAPTAGAAVESLLGDPRRLLLFVLLMNMVVNVSYFVVSSVLTTRMATGLGAAAVGVGSVLAIVVFGEVLAKILAGAARRRFCMVLAPPLATLLALAGPVVAGLDVFVLSPLIRVVRPGHAGAGKLLPGELNELIETGGAAGVLSETERRLLGEVVELGQLRVREAMQPRDRIVSLPSDATAEEIVRAAAANRRTTIVLRGRSLDEKVAGFLHVKRYLAARHGTDVDPDPLDFVEAPLYIPEHARLDTALATMHDRSEAQALCVDERGSIVGLLGADDIIDELLAGMGGERTAERHTIQLVGLGRWSVSARLGARDWARYFGVDEAEIASSLSRSSTLGGVVMDRLGRLPEPGDEVEIGPVRARVESMIGRRIVSVTIETRDGTSPGEGDA